MDSFFYLLRHFFTHKDFLPPAQQLAGTLFTPLHFAFSAVVLCVVIGSALYVSHHKKLIKPVFTAVWAVMVVWEFVIVAWESLSGSVAQLDLQTNLSLYPCSIFLYVMPLAIWGKGRLKQMACGYVCTLGLLGAAINFVYPATRLSFYSCISFPGFHTFSFHGSMLFVCLVMLLSGYHRYRDVSDWKDLFLPCVPTLLLSIPANLVNYSAIGADYMFFRGQLPIIASLTGHTTELRTTIILYVFYIIMPALFYLPAYMKQLHHEPVYMEIDLDEEIEYWAETQM